MPSLQLLWPAMAAVVGHSVTAGLQAVQNIILPEKHLIELNMFCYDDYIWCSSMSCAMPARQYLGLPLCCCAAAELLSVISCYGEGMEQNKTAIVSLNSLGVDVFQDQQPAIRQQDRFWSAAAAGMHAV
jgi:hypothetical protein